MVNEESYECLKGWILAPSPTDGSYVPYFLKVRSKDIVWDETSIPKELTALVESGYNASTLPPSAQMKFDYKEWSIAARADFSFDACKKISIGTGGFNINDGDDSDLLLALDFPFSVKNNSAFSIQCTISAQNEDLATATSNIVYDTTKGTNNIDSVKLHLRNLIYKFDPAFATNKSYINSFVYITIRGVMVL